MKKLLIILFALLPLTVSAAKKKTVKPAVSVENLRVENLDKPLGIDTSEPRFSWQITSDKRNVRQTAYQIVVSGDQGELWNSVRGRLRFGPLLVSPIGAATSVSALDC